MYEFLTIEYRTVLNFCSSALNRQIYLHGNTVGQCPDMGRCLRVVNRLWWALDEHDVVVPFFFAPRLERRWLDCFFRNFRIYGIRIKNRKTIFERY